MAARLFVGNLPYDTTEADLRAHFAAVGPISYISLPTDRETGRPRGFAFIEFIERADAEEAIRRLHNQAFQGRPLAVNEARAREGRPTPDTSRPSASRPSASRPHVAPQLKRVPKTAGTSARTRLRGAGAGRRRTPRNSIADRSAPRASEPPDPCASAPRKTTVTMMG